MSDEPKSYNPDINLDDFDIADGLDDSDYGDDSYDSSYDSWYDSDYVDDDDDDLDPNTLVIAFNDKGEIQEDSMNDEDNPRYLFDDSFKAVRILAIKHNFDRNQPEVFQNHTKTPFGDWIYEA